MYLINRDNQTPFKYINGRHDVDSQEQDYLYYTDELLNQSKNKKENSQSSGKNKKKRKEANERNSNSSQFNIYTDKQSSSDNSLNMTNPLKKSVRRTQRLSSQQSKSKKNQIFEQNSLTKNKNQYSTSTQTLNHKKIISQEYLVQRPSKSDSYLNPNNISKNTSSQQYVYNNQINGFQSQQPSRYSNFRSNVPPIIIEEQSSQSSPQRTIPPHNSSQNHLLYSQPYIPQHFVEKNQHHMIDQLKIHTQRNYSYIPYQQKIVTYEQQLVTVPVQRIVTKHYVVENIIDYVPSVEQYVDGYEMVPVQITKNHLYYLPVETQIVHLPLEQTNQKDKRERSPIPNTNTRQTNIYYNRQSNFIDRFVNQTNKSKDNLPRFSGTSFDNMNNDKKSNIYQHDIGSRFSANIQASSFQQQPRNSWLESQIKTVRPNNHLSSIPRNSHLDLLSRASAMNLQPSISVHPPPIRRQDSKRRPQSPSNKSFIARTFHVTSQQPQQSYDMQNFNSLPSKNSNSSSNSRQNREQLLRQVGLKS